MAPGMRSLHPMSSPLLLVLLAHVGVVQGAPPNVSLATLPIGYIGGSWPNKTDAQIDMLSKLRTITMMQQDGMCWQHCCPNMTQEGRCGTAVGFNSSTLPGCNPGCDQYGTQDAVYARVKAWARAHGRPEPHAMMYANTDYDWPFDKQHAAGAEAIDVVDVNGVPHAERCDPGIFPSYFFDHGRAAGRAAFLSVFRDTVVGGHADGVMLDCFDTLPLKCNDHGVCTAQRNHSPGNNASVVTRDSVEAYTAGLAWSLRNATALVATKPGGGGMFTAKTWNVAQSHDPYGANAAFLTKSMAQFKNDPLNVIAEFDAIFDGSGYTYLNWRAVGYSPPTRAAGDLGSRCNDLLIGSFMLALRPGAFLFCLGWDPAFEQPMGDPLGPATTEGSVTSRRFSRGASVAWDANAKRMHITWGGGEPTPAPAPTPAPQPTPAPPSPAPIVPSRWMPNVNIRGVPEKHPCEAVSYSDAHSCQAECDADPKCLGWTHCSHADGPGGAQQYHCCLKSKINSFNAVSKTPPTTSGVKNPGKRTIAIVGAP